jgi:hypothetical protein
MASVCMLRITQMSSATRAVCGSNSHSQVPLFPCRANRKVDGATGKLFWPEVIPVRRWPRRGRAGLVQIDDPLRLGRVLGKSGERRMRLRFRSGHQAGVHQRSEGGHADAGGGPAEQLPPGEQELPFAQRVHCLVTTSSRLRITLAAVV